MSMTTPISKLLPLFVTSDKGQVNQIDISSLLSEPSSLSSALLALPKPSLSPQMPQERKPLCNHLLQPVVARYDRHGCSPNTTHR